MTTPEDAIRSALNTPPPDDPEMDGDWSVWRQGDDGNEVLIESGLSEELAKQMVADFEAHGHKQLYWASEKPAN